MRKYITVLLIAVFIVPSVAFASWWNPLSWKFFNFLKKEPVKNEQALNTEVTGSTTEEIQALEKRLEELKKQQSSMEGPGKATSAIEDKAALIAEIKSQVTSELKAKAKEEAEANREKTLSEKVGVSRESLAQCIKNTNKEALTAKINISVEKAMKGVPVDQRGTPYAVLIGSNGVKSEVRGAFPYEDVQKVINEINAGVVTNKYEGEIVSVEQGDYIYGNANAKVKIIEYSDFECPYCQRFHTTLKDIVDNSNGGVSWVYRHWPVHNSYEKLIAVDCVGKLKGKDAFWKYSELLFGLMNQEAPSISDKL